MAYEYERDEWRSAVRTLTETERHTIAEGRRRALGIVGDPTDVADQTPSDTLEED